MKNIFVSSEILIDNHKQKKVLVSTDLINYFQSLNINLNYGFSLNNKIINKIVSSNKGLILSGTGDINKLKINKTNLLRDKFEKKLITKFIYKKKPILCICRGFQLYASINKGKFSKSNRHVRKFHNLEIDKNSKFIKYENLKVNSYHNYTITSIDGKKINVISITKDGSIEIAEGKDSKILCIMFHPERKNVSQIKINKIIRSFFK